MPRIEAKIVHRDIKPDKHHDDAAGVTECVKVLILGWRNLRKNVGPISGPI